MKLKITEIRIYPVQIPLNETFVISIGPLSKASITVVQIHTNEGIYGTGECCPFRTIHTESQDRSVEQSRTIAKALIGKDPRQIRPLVELMEQILPGPGSIKAAFDMALFDLNAKLANIPLYQFLNGDPEKVMTTDMTVSFLEKEAMVAKASQYLDDGFTSLKIKLGDPNAVGDIERIRAIRDAIGTTVPLCIDANLAWTYDKALIALEGMKDFEIEHCEAPINDCNHDDLRKLKSRVSIPIMADEAAFSPRDAFELLSGQCVDRINIKLGKAGGILNALKISAIAEAAGAICQVGCFSESRLGIGALAHFSMACSNVVYFDMDAPLMHRDDPIEGGIQYDDHWTVHVNDAPGIGADYDPQFLKNYPCISIVNS